MHLLQEVRSEEELLPLEKVEVYVSEVAPKAASKVLKFVEKSLPTVGLQHLHRIKKVSGQGTPELTATPLRRLFLPRPSLYSEIAAFSCCRPTMPSTSYVVPDGREPVLLVLLCFTSALTREELLGRAAQCGLADTLSPVIGSVPVRAPLTRTQFDSWRALWPMNFHEDVRRFELPDEHAPRQHLQRTVELARRAKANGEHPISVVIVNPQTDTVVVECSDSRLSSGHPLRHAVMNGIAEVARRERGSRAAMQESAPAPPASDNTLLGLPSDAEWQCGGSSERRSVDLDADAGRSPDLSGKEATYLCVGLDVYVTEEPCTMCAMGLVHSRVGRLFYIKPHPQAGAVGSVYRIHTDRHLNHHYKAFTLSDDGYLMRRELAELLEGSKHSEV